MCEVCSTTSKRQSDKARHKYMEEGKKLTANNKVQSNVQTVSNGARVKVYWWFRLEA